ncbi:zinc ribbon domain-containing protein [Methanolobus sp.]|uniref:zinc ribbon domain-containing protein n=1 Tax=Methanolobus sp. TaxID=1874737 RepID=UPI0025DD399E|nr:zinc ribbon domain-containing protein [Methanolobus sp.]
MPQLKAHPIEGLENITCEKQGLIFKESPIKLYMKGDSIPIYTQKNENPEAFLITVKKCMEQCKEPNNIVNNNADTIKNEDTEDVLFCMKCGTKLPSDAVFCMKCGTKLPNMENGNI